jgi:Rap1a immunity proteins
MVGAVNSSRRLMSALALLSIISSPASAASGRQLLQQCEALVRGVVVSGEKVTLPKGRKAAECWFYMGAIQDLTATVESEGGPSILGVCLPAETTRMEIIWTFVRYARSHRSDLHLRATAIIIPAFNKSFPCDKRT